MKSGIKRGQVLGTPLEAASRGDATNCAKNTF
jgi:hypothetical protein